MIKIFTKTITTMLFFILFSSSILNALSVEEIIKENVEHSLIVEKTKIILSKKALIRVKKLAKVAVKTRLYRLYKVKKHHKIVGYGILISRKVRSKKATVLYYINTKGILRFTEILAFKEPPEYKPSKKWMTQFRNTIKASVFKLGKDIPTISGATLSARNVAQGARIAKAIVEVKFK